MMGNEIHLFDYLYVFGLGIVPILLVTVASYFLGCFNGAVIVSKYILKDDVRTHGSGNAGLTNFFRTFGGPLTLVVILLDVLKAVLAVLAGAAVWKYVGAAYVGSSAEVELAFSILGKYWSGLFCLLGHMFPCMFHFKGGKGILSGGVMAIMIDWRVALVVWGGFLLLTALTRYVSLGSVWAGASFPFASWIFVSGDPVVLVLAFLIGGLVVWQHRGNIKRLIKGEERKLTFHRKKE